MIVEGYNLNFSETMRYSTCCHVLLSSYLIHSRAVQVRRLHGIEAAAPRVAESSGKNLGLVVTRHAVDVEPDDLAQKRGARFASCSTTAPHGEVEMPIIATRTEEDLASTRVHQLRRQTHGEDPPHFSWSSSSLMSPLVNQSSRSKVVIKHIHLRTFKFRSVFLFIQKRSVFLTRSKYVTVP